jgi:Staphylococcal nuclease homologue
LASAPTFLGDRLEVYIPGEGKEEVRLRLIDTPEPEGTDKPAQKYGEEVAELEKMKLVDVPILVERGQSEKDDEGRTLVNIWIIFLIDILTPPISLFIHDFQKKKGLQNRKNGIFSPAYCLGITSKS